MNRVGVNSVGVNSVGGERLPESSSSAAASPRAGTSLGGSWREGLAWQSRLAVSAARMGSSDCDQSSVASRGWPAITWRQV